MNIGKRIGEHFANFFKQVTQKRWQKIFANFQAEDKHYPTSDEYLKATTTPVWERRE